MEKNEISVHEVRIFIAVRGLMPKWATSSEIATLANVARRTSRQHLLKLTHLGLVECAEVFPGHRYRIADKADKRNGGYLRRLECAVNVFDLK